MKKIFIPKPEKISNIKGTGYEGTVSYNSWKKGTISKDMEFARVVSCIIVKFGGEEYAVPRMYEEVKGSVLNKIADTLFETEYTCPFTDEVIPYNQRILNTCNHTFWYYDKAEDHVFYVNFITDLKNKRVKLS